MGWSRRHPKTHGGLIGSFGLPLVRTGRLAAAFGRSLNQVQELRLTGDYLAAPVPLEKAKWAVQEANAFVAAIQQYALEEEATVAINGEMHETGYFQPVPPGAEVFFIPRLEGG